MDEAALKDPSKMVKSIIDEAEKRSAVKPVGPPPYTFKFVSRKNWGARLPNFNKLEKHTFPLEHYTYRFTESEPCNERESCIRNLQELQRIHMDEMGLPDIAWNFIIGGDLTVYEGRGWKNKPFHTDPKLKDFTGDSVDVVYMGRQMGGIKKNFYSVEIAHLKDALLDYGQDNNYLDEFAPLINVGWAEDDGY